MLRTDLHYGVAVGIDRYPAIGDLKSARKDAVAFHEWLQNSGVEGDRLQLVCLPDGHPSPQGREGAKPDTGQVWEAVWTKIEKVRGALKANPTDWAATRLYFFFSGHGLAPTAQDASGLAADSGPDHYGNSASIKKLVEWLLESGDFAELIMVADSCRNKPPRGTPLTGPIWTPKSSKRSEEVKVAALFATIYGDPAREPKPDRDPNSERGYYTRALLEGLRGNPGAQRPDGSVTTQSVHSFARQRVLDLTGGKQKPPADAGSDIVLLEGVPGLPPTPRTVRMVFPAAFIGSARLLDGSLSQIDTWSAAQGDWVKPLLPSLYQVEADASEFAKDGMFRLIEGEGEFVVSL